MYQRHYIGVDRAAKLNFHCRGEHAVPLLVLVGSKRGGLSPPQLEDRNMAREMATWGPQSSAIADECSLTCHCCSGLQPESPPPLSSSQRKFVCDENRSFRHTLDNTAYRVQRRVSRLYRPWCARHLAAVASVSLAENSFTSGSTKACRGLLQDELQGLTSESTNKTGGRLCTEPKPAPGKRLSLALNLRLSRAAPAQVEDSCML